MNAAPGGFVFHGGENERRPFIALMKRALANQKGVRDFNSLVR
jgi:hypothetical protein